MDIPHSLFEEKIEAMKAALGLRNDTELTARDLKELVAQYKNVYVEAKGEEFPSGTYIHIYTQSKLNFIIRFIW